jgi:hypothetical protein
MNETSANQAAPALSVAAGSRHGIRGGVVRYKGRYVSRRWFLRYAVANPEALRKPVRKHEKCLVLIYLPALPAVNEPAETWLIDLNSKADRHAMETVIECYAMPGGEELTTFFPHANAASETRGPDATSA